MPTLVLDTNIVLDLFVFNDKAARELHLELTQGRVQWISTVPMRDELERVLDYPHLVGRLAFYQLDATQVLAGFDALVHLHDVAPPAGVTCSDPDDQKFIDLAVAHGATLLSKDAAVLALKKRLAALGVEASPLLLRT